jgi:uncharacterized membrane protein required for colicin V production
MWVDIIIFLILIFSFAGGIKEGAIKGMLSFLSLIIAIPVTGATSWWFTSVLNFIDDAVWQNFLGFLGTFVIISIVLGILLWLPRHFFEKFWDGGCIFGFAGGVFAAADAAVSITLLSMLIHTYPIFDWLDFALTNSVAVSWLVSNLGFIKLMLPQLSIGSSQLVLTAFQYFSV